MWEIMFHCLVIAVSAIPILLFLYILFILLVCFLNSISFFFSCAKTCFTATWEAWKDYFCKSHNKNIK